MLKVYSKAGCVQCTATLRFLKKHKVHYTEIRIDRDDKAREYVMDQLGATQAPVVQLPNGAWWSGFNPDKIKDGIDNGAVQVSLG